MNRTPPPAVETREVRVRRLFERTKLLGHVDEPMLSVYRDRGVVFKDEALNPNKTADDRNIYQLVEPGWLVVNRMKAWQGSLGISEHRGIVSGHYICFRPVHREHGRFLHYLLRSPAYTAHFAAISRGVRPGQIEIDNGQLGATVVSLPGVEEQRRIADFLDDQVSRIDQTMAARRRQSALAQDQFRSRLETSLWAQASGVPLKHLIQNVTSGPRGWGDLMADHGRAFVRIGNLSALGVDMRPSELARVEAPTGSSEAERASLERGDVLLSITAAMGLVAVFELDEPASFSQHVARLRPLRRSDSRWLAWTLQSKSLMDQYGQAAYGGGKVGLGLDHVRNLRVPRYGYQRRAEIAARIDGDWETFRGGREALANSITLLAEYKQSLITAAVTGELDVTTASRRVPA